jgi:hypothetical protein
VLVEPITAKLRPKHETNRLHHGGTEATELMPKLLMTKLE